MVKIAGRLFLLNFKDVEDKTWWALAFADTPEDALKTAKDESQTRFGIRKMGAHDFKVIGELKKQALITWGQWIPCELDEEDFEPLEK